MLTLNHSIPVRLQRGNLPHPLLHPCSGFNKCWFLRCECYPNASACDLSQSCLAFPIPHQRRALRKHALYGVRCDRTYSDARKLQHYRRNPRGAAGQRCLSAEDGWQMREIHKNVGTSFHGVPTNFFKRVGHTSQTLKNLKKKPLQHIKNQLYEN